MRCSSRPAFVTGERQANELVLWNPFSRTVGSCRNLSVRRTLGLVLFAISIGMVAVAQRDLRRRPDTQVHGVIPSRSRPWERR
jgi:hypothetical protein